VEADITDVYSLEDCLDGVSDVYHAAALVSFQPGDQRRMARINVEGTSNLVNVCLDKKIRKFCHVSSIAAIGRAENDRVIDEEVIWKASRRNSPYAVSKYGAEREVWRGIEEGLDAVIVNPSIILGPGEINSGSTRLIRTVEKGLSFYTPGINGFVDVRDVVKAMMLLMDSDISGERFIVSAENVAYKDLFSTIARLLNKKEPRYKAGKWMSEVYWRIEHARSRLTGSRPLVTRETARTAGNNYMYSSEKIRTALDFRFMDMEASLEDACTYYLENK
jgi:nucleoside-diphosphate-sugar epimerase